eukprot:GILJ01000157.1.p2 GENE.GILJ01000157.1~~GILJ01000157.1.p2  ORF type:complete len:477 (-),score=84.52 GILJ01000157.1:1505-2935(-)
MRAAAVDAHLNLARVTGPSIVALAHTVDTATVERAVVGALLSVARDTSPAGVANSNVVNEAAVDDEALGAVLTLVPIFALADTVVAETVVRAFVGAGEDVARHTGVALVAETRAVATDAVAGAVGEGAGEMIAGSTDPVGLAHGNTVRQDTVYNITHRAVSRLPAIFADANTSAAGSVVGAGVRAGGDLAGRTAITGIALAGAVVADTVARAVTVTDLVVTVDAGPARFAGSRTVDELAMNQEPLRAVFTGVASVANTSTRLALAVVGAQVAAGRQLTTSTSPAGLTQALTFLADTTTAATVGAGAAGSTPALFADGVAVDQHTVNHNALRAVMATEAIVAGTDAIIALSVVGALVLAGQQVAGATGVLGVTEAGTVQALTASIAVVETDLSGARTISPSSVAVASVVDTGAVTRALVGASLRHTGRSTEAVVADAHTIVATTIAGALIGALAELAHTSGELRGAVAGAVLADTVA